MVKFITRAYNEENNQMVGAEVVVYSEEGDNIGSIQITTKQQFDDLIERIDGFDEVYVLKSNLQSEVNNLTINAATLDDYSSSDFALRNHTHDGFAITNHASNKSTYGLGSTSKYGHVTIVNNLNSSSYTDGEVLSANQGNILDSKIDSVISDNANWTVVSQGSYWKLYYNASIKMCYFYVLVYDYTGVKNQNNVGTNIAFGNSGTIPSAYCPPHRVISALAHPSMSLWVNVDGSFYFKSLLQADSVQVECSMMWPVL